MGCRRGVVPSVSPLPADADKEKYVDCDACASTAAESYTRTASLDAAFCCTPTLLQSRKNRENAQPAGYFEGVWEDGSFTARKPWLPKPRVLDTLQILPLKTMMKALSSPSSVAVHQ